MTIKLVGILRPPTSQNQMTIEIEGWHMEVEMTSENASDIIKGYAKLTYFQGMESYVNHRVSIDGVYLGIKGIEKKGPLIQVNYLIKV